MNADLLRSKQDVRLSELLLKDPTVSAVNEQIARREGQGPQGTRRRLLATSVRLSKAMAPELHKMAEECIERLGVSIPVELYAYSSPQFNAACVKPEEGRLFIMFSSALLDGFAEDELRFVMGHELGHHVYGHHDIPIGYVLKGQKPASPDLALSLTSWSRYAEISADRAGAYCTQSLDAVARSLFKLASGVTSSVVKFNLADFLSQVDEMQTEDQLPGAGAPVQDWFMTHPFSPLRVKALQMFHNSCLMKDKGISEDQLELGVEGLMALMEPSYLESKADAAIAMRHMLFAGTLLIANANGEISAEEIKIFEDFFGKYKYKENFNMQRLAEDLPKRAAAVVEQNSIPKRMQLVRDLCVMARAEGHARLSEVHKLKDIAELLEVPEFFVDQLLAEEVDIALS
ncbi:M48 family metallopeptidase [uncultured Pseudoteredinibacter sp.]|uniref:M48 family metallopeptidase n=1 Tax=uncultured Pseudoteredinibacter sp. TaxID=1641701 RepID=UPI00262AC38E|nr:M48 family metallopeptidase [uncultured Pseudoteredinibacter sp.]